VLFSDLALVGESGAAFILLRPNLAVKDFPRIPWQAVGWGVAENTMEIPTNKRKSHFEVVRQADIASLIEKSRRFRILSLTYDPSLARTREMLLTGAGFEVSTFSDVDKAIQDCQSNSYDLVVVGHSIPLAERKALVNAVRSRCATPVLAMLRPGEAPVPQADYFFDSTENPARLLTTVQNILRPTERQG